jgi:hypothetical protein
LFEKKTQKTFASPLLTTYPAMAGIYPLSPDQKSFASFLQKRSPSLPLTGHD